jgi:hypothetical protein
MQRIPPVNDTAKLKLEIPVLLIATLFENKVIVGAKLSASQQMFEDHLEAN